MDLKKMLILGLILVFAMGMLVACGGEPVDDDVFEEDFDDGGGAGDGGGADDPFGFAPDTPNYSFG